MSVTGSASQRNPGLIMNHNAFKTVLLVEDEAVTSAFESRMLEKHGYTVLSADTGERAVEMALNNQDIDVILMDIDLGTGIDGTQAAENILRLKKIPVLFLSSHTEQAIVDKTEKITSFGYVVKNSGETVLMASIRMAFRLYDANLANEAKSIELQSANEQLEATNEELQASMEELIRTNDELEELLITHNLSEKALRDSEKEFRSMFDASPAGICVMKDRHFHKVNALFCKMIGYSPEELIGRSAHICYTDEEEYLRVGRDVYGMMEREGRGIGEARIRHKSGSLIDVLITACPIDPHDQSAGAVLTLLEVTDIKQAEEALRSREAILNSIFQASTAGIALLIDRVLIKINQSLCNITGYSQEELLGKTTRQLYFNDEEYNLIGNLYGILERGEIGVSESRLRHKDGNTVNVLINLSPLNPENLQAGVIATILDITERKKMEEARKKSENEFRSLFESVPVGVGLLQNRRFINVNPALSNISGYTREEMLNNMTRILYPDDEEFQRIGKFLYEQMERNGLGIIDARLRHKNGTLIDVMLYLCPVDPNDRAGTIAAIVLDITERKKTENTLEKMLKDKQSLLRELQHRIKNNLAMITNIISLEMENPAPRDANTALESLKGRIASLTSLYDHLFQTDAVSEVRIDQYLHSVVGSFMNAYSTEMGNIRFMQKYGAARVRTRDATAIGLIVNELVTNAFKHAFPDKKNGEIWIEFLKDQNGIVISVSDDGLGPGDNFSVDHPEGFGMLLIKTLAAELGGNFSYIRQDNKNMFSIHIENPS